MTDPSIVRFRALIEAGLAALESRREEVNDLNVFPVADGDTGDNMVLTLRSVLSELDRLTEASEQQSHRAADGIEQISREWRSWPAMNALPTSDRKYSSSAS